LGHYYKRKAVEEFVCAGADRGEDFLKPEFVACGKWHVRINKSTVVGQKMGPNPGFTAHPEVGRA